MSMSPFDSGSSGIVPPSVIGLGREIIAPGAVACHRRRRRRCSGERAGYCDDGGAMTWYETFLWLHVLGAIVWVGMDVAVQAFAFGIMRSNEPVRIAGFARDIAALGHLMAISSLVIIGSAVGLMVNGN
jgi:hypothetical protein